MKAYLIELKVYYFSGFIMTGNLEVHLRQMSPSTGIRRKETFQVPAAPKTLTLNPLQLREQNCTIRNHIKAVLSYFPFLLSKLMYTSY